MTGALDRFRLDGKVAVVTGASSGLGVQFAQALAQAGADLALGARREDRLAETRALIEAQGRRAIAVGCDVTEPAECDHLVEAAFGAFGRVDVLVNNAGVAAAVPASKESPEQFRSVIELNLNACYWMAQACGRVMRPGSSIINIASILAMTSLGLPQAGYTASKAGLIGLTRDLAQQWSGRKGIRVNAIAPGYFASEMTDRLENGWLESTVVPRAVLGRLGAPGELDGALIFLASGASTYVTGVTIPVDGGVLLT